MRKSTRFKIQFAGVVFAGIICLAVAGIGAIALAVTFIIELFKLSFA